MLILDTMIDTVQVVLLFVIVILTALLVAVGIQVFFVLKDLRTTIGRANKILDNAESITESVSEPMSFISGLILSTKSLNVLSKLFHGKKRG